MALIHMMNSCSLQVLNPQTQRPMSILTNHYVGKGDGLVELSLYELGHEGSEAREQRRQVDLRQNHQQVDGTPQCPQSDTRKT